jgi:hypothetical protein
MTHSLLVEYYMLMPFVIFSIMLIAYIAVRWALDVRDSYQARRMRPYATRYGSVQYYGTVRDNFRTGQRP